MLSRTILEKQIDWIIFQTRKFFLLKQPKGEAQAFTELGGMSNNEHGIL